MSFKESGLRIGQLADIAGVTPDTIRFYERQKLLPAPKRTTSGYRKYFRDTVARLNFIRKAQRMGFSLDQIKTILYQRDRGNAPCDSVIGMTRQKLKEVEAELKLLQKTRRQLTQYLKNWESEDSGSCCAAEEFCSLISKTG